MGTLVRYTDRKGGEAVEYSNRELVRGIKGGDQSALELLVRRWYPRIYGYVFKLTGHEQDAYDLTQDVFIAMMQSIGSYTPWRKFDSWLFTIAHNKCMDYFRFRQKIVQAEDTMFDRPDPTLFPPICRKGDRSNDEHTAADGQITASCRQKYTLR